MLPGYSLGQRLMFQAKEQVVQTLLSNFHWVAIFNLNSKHGTLGYYESLFHGRIENMSGFTFVTFTSQRIHYYK